MANLTDADVTIYAEKVGRELADYINLTKEDTDYAIVYGKVDDSEIDKDGNLEVRGSSSGRWFYGNNLEGYFDKNKVKQWLGVTSDYSWLQDEDKKKQYQVQSQEQYQAFLKLINAIKEKNGRIDISFTDCDPAMDWMGEGSAMLEVFEGEVVFSQSFEEETLDITKYCEMNGMSLYDAFEMLHGEEPAQKWQEYVKECEKKGVKPKDPQQWYDNDFEWEE